MTHRRMQDIRLSTEAPGDNSAASQRARILWHLKEVEPLTTFEARHILDRMHPTQWVLELRSMGFHIVKIWCTDCTLEGRFHPVAQYRLAHWVRHLLLPGIDKGGE